ncbi:Flp family type IVb pilin [Propionivibrio sp.]|uniref:Flp family type IVb pilin n=1 Tax=Propionivibrio sp. TaxID=2212460 RepID=UPI00272E3A98|nr:Flp family type IVb pilin [Propionivibrio sp.]
MRNLMNSMKSFWQDEEGVTAIEYGLIAALIAVFIIASLQLVGGSLDGVFTFISGKLDGATGG